MHFRRTERKVDIRFWVCSRRDTTLHEGESKLGSFVLCPISRLKFLNCDLYTFKFMEFESQHLEGRGGRGRTQSRRRPRVVERLSQLIPNQAIPRLPLQTGRSSGDLGQPVWHFQFVEAKNTGINASALPPSLYSSVFSAISSQGAFFARLLSTSRMHHLLCRKLGEIRNRIRALCSTERCMFFAIVSPTA